VSDGKQSTLTLREIRRAGTRAFFARAWFGRALFVTAVLYAVQTVVAGLFVWARRAGFSSWSDFAEAKARALAAGLDYVVPSRTASLNLTYASAFETFVTLVFAGIFSYGLTAFALRMVRDDSTCGYAAGAFSGFARPLGLAWLLFRIQLQITLWSFLFLIPGVVAYYRYRAAWYLKAEHPDWSAGRCLAESGRVMRGQKGRCFALDCSYWVLISLILILIGFLAAGFALSSSPFQTLLMGLAVFLIVCLGWCVFAGRTIFYLSITTDRKDSSLQ